LKEDIEEKKVKKQKKKKKEKEKKKKDELGNSPFVKGEGRE